MTSPSEPVPPLRIQKGTTGSPVKNAIPRPLSEIAPTEKRRNSPSYNHAAKKMLLNGDSSPFQSSAEGSSPRLFWQGRDPATSNRFSTENLAGARDSSLSPTRRSSIERLQKASRVKNSNMFAREQKQEYDPTAMPVIERPLAKHLQGNAYGGKGLEGFRSSDNIRPTPPNRLETRNSISLTTTPVLSPPSDSSRPGANGVRSPSKDQISPTKSSMASSRYNGKALYDPEHNSWEEENSGDERELPPGRALHRHAKSVTFDAAPPQINEYEMATPDISSIGTGSRENSYDSAEDDDDDSYLHGDSLDQDDSFDASLEDTDKTPVVGPEDWRHSGESSNYGMASGYYDDPFEGPDGSPLPDARPSSSGRPGNSLNDSLNSNGEHRPLPPLPGMAGSSRNGSVSSNTPGAEGRATSPRNLPTPPPASISKTDLQLMNGSKLTLEERLQLMMIQDDETPKTAAEQQRERRMRRAGARNSHTPEHDRQQISIHEDEDNLDDLSGLDSYKLPPRISRESILRKVKGQEPFARESDWNFSSGMASSSPERPSTSDLANIDPDTPIPTTESTHDDDEDSVIIKSEADDDDADIYSISERYQAESRTESYPDEETDGPTDDDDETEDDEESHYSDDMPPHESPQFQSNSVPEDDGPPTPRNISPASLSMDTGKGERRISLPEFSGLMNETDFGLSLKSYMTPSPPPQKEPEQRSASKMSETHEHLAASETPEAVEQPSTNSHKTKEQTTESLPEDAPEEAPTEVMENNAEEEVPEPQEERAPSPESRKMLPRPEYDGSEWGPQEDEEEDEESDAGSVIHHPLISPTPPPPSDSPGIPEQVATIKASSGSKLKTRPSVTPSDLAAMREARRQVSGTGPVVPPIPQRHRNRPSLGGEQDEEDDTVGNTLQRHPSFKKRSLTLDIGGDLGLSLESDFDRVIEAQKVAFNLSSTHSTFFNSQSGQASESLDSINLSDHANQSPRQRGYLMRQNTKVVVASSDHTDDSRGVKSAGNSPTKADRPQSWVVEPWNGNRKSSRSRPGSPRKKPPTGAIPPMPGHESNATGLGILPEGQTMEPTPDEGAERGRLFVKVIGVKDLDLPLPKNERSWFSLTLDNGVHCVTTAWLELGKNAPIGQEFELVVPNELEFQLTLNAKLEKPAPKRVQTAPVKPQKASKPSTFSRVFASPKKRKELEMRHKEEEQRIAQQKQQDAQAAKTATQQTAWDLLSPLAAADGSFGRSYVCLKDHESRCFGRPYNVDVACFNEWATEEIQSSSVMSKRSANTQVRKRAPYAVGKLQLQLLFVPKPKGASDEDMPKSMNACIREMKEAELEVARQFEGHLSQQGGDCPYWRRRFFRLAGSKLTAYHESTRQPRVTINLANAHKLIDDRRALTQKETTGKAGKRRKSGFAEDEEGYMFVEEGFRIRFNNGEVIDFYADSPADKEAWMSVLDACVGKEREGGKGGWCDLVLKREEQMLRKASGASGKGRGHSRIKSTIF